jgi:hypothetical protein
VFASGRVIEAGCNAYDLLVPIDNSPTERELQNVERVTSNGSTTRGRGGERNRAV